MYIIWENIVKAISETTGPYEWVQLTHEHLRIAPDGEFIANMDSDGQWIRESDGQDFTDIIIGAL